MTLPGVDSEARAFVGLVQCGVCTVAQARSDIDVSPKQKAWFRQNFRQDSEIARPSWRFRAQVLARFDELINQQLKTAS